MEQSTHHPTVTTMGALLTWHTQGIICSLAETPDPQGPFVDVDVTTLLVAQCRFVNSDEKMEANYWFPPDVNDKQQIKQLFLNQFVTQGFAGFVRTNLTETNGDVRIVFKCFRGVLARHGKQNKKNTTTQRPSVKEDLCPFQLTVMQSGAPETYGRWFIRKFNAGSHQHIGHPSIPPKYVKGRKSLVTEEQWAETLQQLEMNVPPDIVRRLLSAKTGVNMTNDALHRQKDILYKQVVLEGGTPAERLITHLEQSDSRRYVACTAEFSQSEHLVTLYLTKKGSTKEKIGTEPLMSATECLDGDAAALDKETPGSYASQLYRALSLKDGQAILLACFWMSDQQSLYFRKFPSILGFDVTKGTNKEKRPLGRGVVTTGDGKNAPIFDVLMPSEAGWVFRWIFLEALPKIASKLTLSQVRVVITDQDSHCYEQIDAAIWAKIIAYALHRLCKWHKVNRGFVLKAMALVRNAVEKKFIKACSRWFYSFSDSIETQEEEVAHRKGFTKWLNRQQINEPLKEFSTTFWTKTFEPMLHRICFRHYKHLPGGGVGSTSFVESENSAMKRSTMRPNPSQSIDTAQNSMERIVDDRMDRMEAKAMYSLTAATVVNPNLPEQEAQLLEVLHTLQRDVVQRKANMIYDQWLSKDCYFFCRGQPGTFYVRRYYEIAELSNAEKDPVDRYARTRTVEVKDVGNNQNLVTCSCGFYNRTGGCPCRHMLCVMMDPPTPKNCGVRLLKSYEALFGKDDAFTTVCIEEIGRKFAGPVIDGEVEVDQRFELNEDREFILAPMKNVICVQKRNWQLMEGETENNNLLSGLSSNVRNEQGFLQLLTNIPEEESERNVHSPIVFDSVANESWSEAASSDSDCESWSEAASSDSDCENDDDPVKDAFIQGQPLYSSMCELVRNKAELRYFLKGLSETRNGLLSMQRAFVEGSHEEGALCSLPAPPSRSTKDKRKAPFGSPSRSRRKKR